MHYAALQNVRLSPTRILKIFYLGGTGGYFPATKPSEKCELETVGFTDPIRVGQFELGLNDQRSCSSFECPLGG